MTKNIAVIDEQGNRYEATYLKRAKGLVKSGRARFVDEKTICLARPPDKSEDKTMSENMGSKDYSSENLNARNLNAEKTNSESMSALESMSAESLSTKNPDSQGSNPEDLSSVEELKKRATAYLDAINSTEDLKKRALAYLATVQEKTGERQKKPGEGQEKQTQEKALSREIVERVLDQLDHFAPDDDYLTQLAKEHTVEGNDMVEVVSMRESTRQKQLEVYKTVLEKAIENEVPAHVKFADAMEQLERVTDWISALNRDDFDPETWEMIRTKAFELLERVTASAW